MAEAARQYARAPHTKDPSAVKLLNVICATEESAIAFAEEVGLLPSASLLQPPQCIMAVMAYCTTGCDA